MSFSLSRIVHVLVIAVSLWWNVAHSQDKAPISPASEVSQQVQAHLGLYVTRPDRRDEGEQVYVRRERVEAWLLRPLSVEGVEQAVCDGARWLLKGRLNASRGAGPLFEKRPEMRELSIIFYDVKTRVDPDRDGRYRQRRSIDPQARFTMSRERFKQLDLGALESELQGPDCARTARVVLDEVWVKELKAP